MDFFFSRLKHYINKVCTIFKNDWTLLLSSLVYDLKLDTGADNIRFICPQFSEIHYSAHCLCKTLIRISKRFIEKYIVSDIDLPLKYTEGLDNILFWYQNLDLHISEEKVVYVMWVIETRWCFSSDKRFSSFEITLDCDKEHCIMRIVA